MTDSNFGRAQTLHFITIHPEFIRSYCEFGVLRSALAKGLTKIEITDLREFAIDNRGTVDDRPFGGGDGMVLRPEPLARAIKAIEPTPYVVLTSPSGTKWSEQTVRQMGQIQQPIALICGRFGGIDQRFIDQYVDLEISMGDFILSGGELPALTIVDSLVRKIPGALGNPVSAANDSFANQNLEYPLYTRPTVFEGLEVPSVLRSGDHKRIEKWRKEKSEERTRRWKANLIKDNGGR